MSSNRPGLARVNALKRSTIAYFQAIALKRFEFEQALTKTLVRDFTE